MLELQARGRLEAVAAVAELPADVASALLPAGLELGPQDSAPAGRHPLVLLLGEHSRVGPDRLRFGLRYLELVIALPFVRPRPGPPGPFCHLPVLWLERRLPILLGRWLYGFAKRRAAIRRAGDGFEVRSRSDGALLLETHHRPAAATFDLGPVRRLFEQPLIGRGPRGRWRYASFDFGLERARLAAAEVELRVHPGLVPGLPAGALEVKRAFRIETEWRLRRMRPPS